MRTFTLKDLVLVFFYNHAGSYYRKALINRWVNENSSRKYLGESIGRMLRSLAARKFIISRINDKGLVEYGMF